MGEKAKIIFFGEKVPKRALFVLRHEGDKVVLEDRQDSKCPILLNDFPMDALDPKNVSATINAAYSMIEEQNPVLYVQEHNCMLPKTSEPTTPKAPISWGAICVISMKKP